MQCVSVCVLKCPVVRHRAWIDKKRGKRKRKQKKRTREMCTKPLLHIGSMQVHTVGPQSTRGVVGGITASGSPLSAPVLMKQRACPQSPVCGLNDTTVRLPGCRCEWGTVLDFLSPIHMYIYDLNAEEAKEEKGTLDKIFFFFFTFYPSRFENNLDIQLEEKASKIMDHIWGLAHQKNTSF